MTVVQSTLLSDAYKSQAELEVLLNVAKSNPHLVISNNEMLEDALRREISTQSRDVGSRRTSGRDDNRSVLERSQSMDYAYTVETPSPPVSANTDNRFFKFPFSSSTAPPSRPSSSARPGTPSSALSSPSMPSLPSHVKELEELTPELAKKRAAKKTITDEKAALEAEFESLSQALFEEVRSSAMSFIITVYTFRRRTKWLPRNVWSGRKREKSSKKSGKRRRHCAVPFAWLEGRTLLFGPAKTLAPQR